MDGPPINWSDPAERDRALEHVTRRCIPILEFAADTPSRIATGTLVTIERRSFVITAAHVLTSLGRDEPGANVLGIPDARGEPIVLRFHGHGLGDCDVAVLELLAGESERLGGRYTPIELGDLYDFGSTPIANDFLLCGYPGVRQSIGQHGGELRALAYRAPAYAGPAPDDVDWVRPFVSDQDFLLAHRELALDSSGRPVEVPDVAGMSGGALWCLTPERFPRTLRVLGVQCSAADGRFIRCTLWTVLASFIAHNWPDLKSTLESHIPGLRTAAGGGEGTPPQ